MTPKAKQMLAIGETSADSIEPESTKGGKLVKDQSRKPSDVELQIKRRIKDPWGARNEDIRLNSVDKPFAGMYGKEITSQNLSYKAWAWACRRSDRLLREFRSKVEDFHVQRLRDQLYPEQDRHKLPVDYLASCLDMAHADPSQLQAFELRSFEEAMKVASSMGTVGYLVWYQHEGVRYAGTSWCSLIDTELGRQSNAIGIWLAICQSMVVDKAMSMDTLISNLSRESSRSAAIVKYALFDINRRTKERAAKLRQMEESARQEFLDKNPPEGEAKLTEKDHELLEELKAGAEDPVESAS
jgi:hypothetical protein